MGEPTPGLAGSWTEKPSAACMCHPAMKGRKPCHLLPPGQALETLGPVKRARHEGTRVEFHRHEGRSEAGRVRRQKRVPAAGFLLGRDGVPSGG